MEPKYLAVRLLPVDKIIACGTHRDLNHCFVGSQTFTKLFVPITLVRTNHLLQKFSDDLV